MAVPLILLTFICLLSGLVSASARLFDCQPSSQGGGQVFSPNIPDLYFSSSNAEAFSSGPTSNLTSALAGITYVFTPPAPQSRCVGNVQAVEYCYKLSRSSSSQMRIFSLLSLTADGDMYTVALRYDIRSIPSSSKCSGLYCCDRTPLPGPFSIPASRYSFGIVTSNSNAVPLAFLHSVTQFNVEQLQLSLGSSGPLQGQSFRMIQTLTRPLLLIRFFIGQDVEATTTTPETVSTPTTMTATTVTTTETATTITTEAATTATTTETATTVTTTEAAATTGVATIRVMTTVQKTSTTNTTDKTSASEPVTVSTTSESDVTTASDTITLLSDSGVVSAALVGGIVGGIIAVSILLLLCIALLIVLLMRKSKKYIMNTDHDGMYATNAIYEECEVKKDYAGTCPHVYSEVEINSTGYAEAGASYLTNSYEEMKEDIYMEPGKDERTLYSQLNQLKMQTLSRDSIELGKQLGSGQFGVVLQGEWFSPKGGVEVAVKTLKKGSKREDRVKFLQEAAIMGQFRHPNVVTLHGVVTTGEPVLIVLELLSGGDLRKHLKKFRLAEGGIDDHTLLSYCRQVASGMTYLSSKAFIHRDLAARNILVTDDYACKIADFGMSRDLMDEKYYVSSGGKIPVKWTAPEALHYKKYSTASDVWSYGALMYEIWSLGHKPFEGITNAQAIVRIDKGERLPPPPGCPRELYTIMMSCWHPKTSERPSFSKISRQLFLPDSKLLMWSEEDKAVHPEAAKLGAGLLSAQELYKDLQLKYTDHRHC